MQIQLEPGMIIVGEAASGEDVLALVQQLRPDIVVMDVEMPGMGGILATARLHTSMPQCRVVILTIHDDPDTRMKALAAGASAFVSKGAVDPLLATLRDLAGTAG